MFGNPHHYSLFNDAVTWENNMGALSQGPARPLDFDHPSVEVIAFCRPVATYASFAEPRFSNTLWMVEACARRELVEM